MYKKKSFFVILSVLSLCLYFTACTKPDIDFGQTYLDNSFTNIISVDTVTPVISTVFIDSFVSSNTGKGLVGKYTDPYFGTVTAQSYFPLVPPSFSDIYTKSMYDSLELIIKPDKTYYGDTTLPINISVNQLTEQIAYAENKSSFYSVSSFASDPNPLGTKSMIIRPSATDTISIRLSDALGTDLLNRLKNGDDAVKSNDKFLQYFKGVKLSAGNSSYMIGFSDSIIMRLHYRDPGVIVQSKSIDFTISNAALQFNHIDVDRSASAISGLNANNREIVSSATNNMSLMQSATGSVIKVRFPYLRNLLQLTQLIKIVKAQLIIKPLKNSFNGQYPLPPLVRLSQTQINEFGADITSSTTGTAAVEYGDLQIDNLYGINTNYVYDVTSYITAQMAITTNNSNGLLLSPPSPSYTTTFNRLVVGDNNSATPGVQLKLYYLTIAK